MLTSHGLLWVKQANYPWSQFNRLSFLGTTWRMSNGRPHELWIGVPGPLYSYCGPRNLNQQSMGALQLELFTLLSPTFFSGRSFIKSPLCRAARYRMCFIIISTIQNVHKNLLSIVRAAAAAGPTSIKNSFNVGRSRGKSSFFWVFFFGKTLPEKFLLLEGKTPNNLLTGRRREGRTREGRDI